MSLQQRLFCRAAILLAAALQSILLIYKANLCAAFGPRTTLSSSLYNGQKTFTSTLALKPRAIVKPVIPVLSRPSSFQNLKMANKQHFSTASSLHATTSSSSSSSSSKTASSDDMKTTTQPFAFQRLVLYNSKTRTKEVFVPQALLKQQQNADTSKSLDQLSLDDIAKIQVSMYTCGPTVYDYAHVGNFRAFLTYDLLKRTLMYLGYKIVFHVCNLTDIDDKIIQRANKDQVPIKQITLLYEDYFMRDLHALNIIPANVYPRATDHLPAMMDMILLLHSKGFAYETPDGSWYFDTQVYQSRTNHSYGSQLVQNINWHDMAVTERGDSDYKRHQADFCLWKAYKEGYDRLDASWSSNEIKLGRPGWHLECSAMSRVYFGEETLDLHGGGVDLKFPHHENEIAQSQGVSGKTFCNCWFHNGFVNLNEEKMSKSLGNYLTLRTACPTGLDVRAYRYLVISSQYRNPLAFTPAAMQASKNAIQRIDKVRGDLQQILSSSAIDSQTQDENKLGSEIASKIVPQALENFRLAICDDLSMPRAAAALFSLVKAAENEVKRQVKKDGFDLDLVGLQAINDALTDMDQVFGIFYEVPLTDEEIATAEAFNEQPTIPVEVLDLVSQRSAAKESKDWALADSLRSRVLELGFSIKDVKDGEPIISRVE